MARGEYCYDYDRTAYLRAYYRRNKHRKKYSYVKKGVMKQLSKAQFEILVKMQTGHVLYKYLDAYRYFEDGRYYQLNTRSVECLLTSKHVVLSDDVVRLTEKGINHKQNSSPTKTN